VSGAALDHEGSKGADHEEGAAKVDGHEAVPVLERYLVQGRAHLADASVIDEDIAALVLLPDGLGEGFDLRGLGEIEGKNGGVLACGMQLLGQSLEVFAMAGAEYYMRAQGSEPAGDGAADSSAGSGNDCYLIVQHRGLVYWDAGRA